MNNSQLIEHELAKYAEDATNYYNSSKSPKTVRAYRSDLRVYEEVCKRYNLKPLPASLETIALFIAQQAQEYGYYTVVRRLSAISSLHIDNGYAEENPMINPQIKVLLKGLRKNKSLRQDCATPLLTADITRIIYKLPDSLKGIRDKAMLLLGWAGCMRRSEVAAMDVGDIKFEDFGMLVTIRHSKTDQEGKGYVKSISNGMNSDTCPVKAVKDWIKAAKLTEGALFYRISRGFNLMNRISAPSISIIVKGYVKLIGKNPDDYGGHSLRAGFATQASMNGLSDHQIMQQGGWTSTCYHRYIRYGELYNSNVSQVLGL